MELLVLQILFIILGITLIVLWGIVFMMYRREIKHKKINYLHHKYIWVCLFLITYLWGSCFHRIFY